MHAPNLFDTRSHFRDNLTEWRAYYDDVAPHETDLPQPWNARLNDFQMMLAVRCIRPDKVRVCSAFPVSTIPSVFL